VSTMDTRIVPADWSATALHAAGAASVAEVREAGVLTGYEVRPPVSDEAYEVAAAATRKAALVAYASDKRWRREVRGIVVAGVPVATDDRAKLMITGARLAATSDPQWSTVWHGTDGQTYPVDVPAMIAISDAVQGHVNSGFATFATVKTAIDAGSITTTAEVDAAFD
jgi:hypothetical protein